MKKSGKELCAETNFKSVFDLQRSECITMYERAELSNQNEDTNTNDMDDFRDNLQLNFSKCELYNEYDQNQFYLQIESNFSLVKLKTSVIE